ncbi:uncharacterized protein AKAME5_001687100 [Lates japonicus]|uniref:Uncharacterized protein n=1 Tax=Lates japonicus TaxID=270547 RepID=A0AAD3RED5_LATJO|nr:uncharacterized protein AKAME5_001687100 [Lates japonicus]
MIPASSESNSKDFLVKVPDGNWADHMEYVERLAIFEPFESASHPQPELATHHDDDDVLDIGLDIHSVSEDDQETLLLGQCAAAAVSNDLDHTFFFLLYCHAAEKLEAEWPSPQPAQKPSWFAGFFLPPEPKTVKNRLPMFPDFVTDLTSTWNKPLSTRVTVPSYGQYLDFSSTPMEPSLAAYLAPSHHHGMDGPTTLPSKHCRFSAS